MTERLYYADTFLTDFDAVVTDIQELARANGQSLWRVALDRSAFYPTSGGQPCDTGTLTATARSGAELTAEIVAVEEDESGEVWHHTAKPLLAGTAVRGAIEPERRWDHAQQHSGQHLLSAAFVQVCGAPTVSFHLGASVSTIDLAAETLAQATLDQVEELANRILAEDRPITVRAVSREQAEALLAAGQLRKLPPRAGDLRLIEIAGFDLNACGGTHVRSTGQIGGLHLRGTEKVRQGIRVEFICGPRAMRRAREDFHGLTEAARLLSVRPAEMPDALLRLQTESRQAAKQLQTLTVELAGYRAAELIRQTAPQHGARLITVRLSAAECPDAAYAKLLASQVTSRAERTIALVTWRRESDPGQPATVVFARSADLDFDCGALLRRSVTAHAGRGGGSGDMAQGSVPQEHLSRVVEELLAASRA